MVNEVKEDLEGAKPSCIVVSVGGGGLLLGVLRGLEKVGWQDVPILTMETIGADCFNLSVKANKMIEIQITSIAKTLGARQVASALMERYPMFNITSEVLPDKDAVHGCIRLAGDTILYFSNQNYVAITYRISKN
jgi:L-serine/L-threonine ammonia-lyase